MEWNYEEIWIEISMPGYIRKVLQKYKHESPPKPQQSPYVIAPKKYGKDSHDHIPLDESKTFSNEKSRESKAWWAAYYYTLTV